MDCSKVCDRSIAVSPQSTSQTVTVGIVNDTVYQASQLPNTPAVEVTRILCTLLKLNCVFRRTPHEQHFTFENETWGGLFGDLLNGTYDLSIPIYFYSQLRSQYFSFSHPTLYEFYYFVTRSPTSYTDWFSVKHLTGPFSWSVWAILLLTTTLLSLFVWFYHKKMANYTDILITYINVSALLLKKSQKFNGLTLAGKSLLNLWAISTIVITAYYTSGLLSSLIRVQPKPPFTDYESLISCLKIKKCQMILNENVDYYFMKLVEDNSSIFYEFKSILDEQPAVIATTHSEMYEKIVSTESTYLVSGALTSADVNVLLKFQNDCSLLLLEHYSPTYFMLRKDDPLVASIDSKIDDLEQTGILPKLVKKLREINRCRLEDTLNYSTKTSASPIQLKLIFSAVLIALIGFMVGLTCFTCEIYSKRAKKQFIFNLLC